MPTPSIDAVKAVEGEPNRRAQLDELRTIVVATKEMPTSSIDRRAILDETHRLLSSIRMRIESERKTASDEDRNRLDAEDADAAAVEQEVKNALRDAHLLSPSHVFTEGRAAVYTMSRVMGKKVTRPVEAWDTLRKEDMVTQSLVVGAVTLGVSTLYGLVRGWFRKAEEKTGVWAWTKRTAVTIAAAVGGLWLWNFLRNWRAGSGGAGGAGAVPAPNVAPPSQPSPDTAPPPREIPSPQKPDKQPEVNPDTAPPPRVIPSQPRPGTAPPPREILPPQKPDKQPEVKEEDSDPDDVIINEARERNEKVWPRWELPIECLSLYSRRPDAALVQQRRFYNPLSRQLYSRDELLGRLRVLRGRYAKRHPGGKPGDGVCVSFREIRNTPYPFWTVEYQRALAQEAGIGLLVPGRAKDIAKQEWPSLNEPYRDENWIERFAYPRQIYIRGNKIQIGEVTYLIDREYEAERKRVVDGGWNVQDFERDNKRQTDLKPWTIGPCLIGSYSPDPNDNIFTIRSLLNLLRNPEQSGIHIHLDVTVLGPTSKPPAAPPNCLMLKGEAGPCSPDALGQKIKALTAECKPAKAHFTVDFHRHPGSSAFATLYQPLIDELDQQGHRMRMDDEYDGYFTRRP